MRGKKKEPKPLTLSTLPRCNGRPQLWWSDGPVDRLRILYPDGRVQFFRFPNRSFTHGCTSRSSQKDAQEACIRWSWGIDTAVYFLGYL